MKQILIVEDDSFLNKMLAYNLTADGYGVTSALNARTAAEAIRQREFDLVLLDINLPDGNGFELCKQGCCAGSNKKHSIHVHGRRHPL